MVCVTYNQEAMTIADRIAVMHESWTEELEPPFELYDAPANLSMAGFVGSPVGPVARTRPHRSLRCRDRAEAGAGRRGRIVKFTTGSKPCGTPMTFKRSSDAISLVS